MRYEDQRLLLTWAKLQFEISVSRCPVDGVNMSADRITRSVGYQKLRAWFMQLSPRAKADARRWMTSQVDGIRQLLAKARASKEQIDMGDITIEVFDHAGEELKVPDFEQVPACSASGSGLPGIETDGFVQCPKCLARWDAHEIQFKLPSHEPIF